MMSALASARLTKLWILFQNNFLDGALCKNVFHFHIFSLFFLVFERDIIRRAGFTRISASNIESDDVTNYRSHIEYLRDLVYSCANFVVEINEKSSHD